MKFWALAGFLAGAVLLTLLAQRKEPKVKAESNNPENRYDIEELLVDSDS